MSWSAEIRPGLSRSYRAFFCRNPPIQHLSGVYCLQRRSQRGCIIMAHLGRRLQDSSLRRSGQRPITASVTISRLLPSASPPSSYHLDHSDSTLPSGYKMGVYRNFDTPPLAERTRFELVVGLLLRQFSKLVVSATHPPLHWWRAAGLPEGRAALISDAKVGSFFGIAKFLSGFS